MGTMTIIINGRQVEIDDGAWQNSGGDDDLDGPTWDEAQRRAHTFMYSPKGEAARTARWGAADSNGRRRGR
jgi:hypothetical protein